MTCAFCGGSGVRESTKAADVDSVASWCHCPVGVEREASRPGWVDEVNRARAVLRKPGRKGPKDLRQQSFKQRVSHQTDLVGEVYSAGRSLVASPEVT